MRFNCSDFGAFSWLPPGYLTTRRDCWVRFECSDFGAFSWLPPGYLTTRRDCWVRFECSDFGAFSRLPLGEVRLFKILVHFPGFRHAMLLHSAMSHWVKLVFRFWRIFQAAAG